MLSGVPSSVKSPQCRSTSQLGSMYGSSAPCVSERTRNRTGVEREWLPSVLARFVELGGDKEEASAPFGGMTDMMPIWK
jgi:hypothetical protein